MKEYPISDEYLLLAGLFVSEGTINFRHNKHETVVKSARLTQTENGKKEFFDKVTILSKTFDMKRYDYETGTIWVINRNTAKQLFSDFGHGCKEGLRLAKWCFKLSHRQASIFWEGLFLGDGTSTSHGSVIYTSNEKLAGDYQAMMVSSGYSCSVNGPYCFNTLFNKNCVVYYVYLSSETGFKCIDFNRGSRFLPYKTTKSKVKNGYPIKEIKVQNARVVCFMVPNRTLITRSNGKQSTQGNCKNAYHTVRLMSEVEMILEEGDLDLQRNREQIKSIRRGEWTEQEVIDYFSRKEIELETLYHKSTLPHSPDEHAIKQLLLSCLEQHYGSIDEMIVVADKYEHAIKEIEAICSKVKEKNEL